VRCVEFREYRKSTTTTNNSKLTRVFDLLWCELKIVPQSGSLIGLPFSVQPSFARRAGTFSRACARIFDSLRDVTPTAVRRQMGSTQLGGRDAQRGALDDVRASVDRPKIGPRCRRGACRAGCRESSATQQLEVIRVVRDNGGAGKRVALLELSVVP